jgi:hypothetical protein
MIALVGMAAVAMSSRFAADMRRTRDAKMDAQLRQMLLARGQSAAGKAGRWEEMAAAAPLPGELAGKVKVAVSPKPDEAVALIEAELDGRTMRQELTWARSGEQWVLRAAVLNP